MHRDFLAVEVLPGLVELGVHDRVEAQRGELEEDAHRHLHLLDQRVGAADADVGLAADHRLGGDVLGLEIGHLDLDALLLGALQRDEEMQRLDAGDVAEGDADLGFGLVSQAECRREREGRHAGGEAGEGRSRGGSGHVQLPGCRAVGPPSRFVCNAKPIFFWFILDETAESS
jgi:hypothetical protein